MQTKFIPTLIRRIYITENHANVSTFEAFITAPLSTVCVAIDVG